MSQPTLTAVPDDQAPRFYSGTVNSAEGSLWFFNGSNPLGRAETVEFGTVFPEAGSTYVFNGLLLIPTVQEYLLPRARVDEIPRRSGIYIPMSMRNDYDWTLAKAQGIYPYVNDQGEFRSTIHFKMFDRKNIFRCVERRMLNAEEEIQPALDDIRAQALGTPTLRLWAVQGLCIYVVDVEFQPREYLPPPVVPPRPVVIERDDGDDKPKPRRRTRRQED